MNSPRGSRYLPRHPQPCITSKTGEHEKLAAGSAAPMKDRKSNEKSFRNERNPWNHGGHCTWNAMPSWVVIWISEMAILPNVTPTLSVLALSPRNNSLLASTPDTK